MKVLYIVRQIRGLWGTVYGIVVRSANTCSEPLPTVSGNSIKTRVCDGVMNTHHCQSHYYLVQRALARDFGLMEPLVFGYVCFYFNSFRSAFWFLVCGAFVNICILETI